MAREITIPITDHNTPGVCTSYYGIRIKLASVDNWTDLPDQYGTLTGSPAGWAVVIAGLADDLEYDYEITRFCCPLNGLPGTFSAVASGSFTTTP